MVFLYYNNKTPMATSAVYIHTITTLGNHLFKVTSTYEIASSNLNIQKNILIIPDRHIKKKDRLIPGCEYYIVPSENGRDDDYTRLIIKRA